jgi:uncharacterized protein (TIGR02118 family)
MIKVSVMYPNGQGQTFDMAYYLNKHIPMVKQKLGAALKNVTVEQGVAGAAPGAPPTYLALGNLYFDTAEAFQAAFAPHAPAIMGDVANYTNTQPVVQISAVKL